MTGRDLFTFNADMIFADDDEADDVAYDKDEENVDVKPWIIS